MDTYPTITPRNVGSSLDCISFVANAQLILDIFSINLFAESSTISLEKELDEGTGKSYLLRVTSRLPANLWSLQVLQKRKDSPVNSFEVKTLLHYAALSHCSAEVVSTAFQNQLDVVHFLKFSTT